MTARPSRAWLVSLLLVSAVSSGWARGGADSLLQAAITAAGGDSALSSARALSWEGDASVHTPGRTIRLHGTWRILPPDSALVATYEIEKGPSSTRRVILAGRQGWLQRDTVFDPMPPDFIGEERHQFHLYSLLRLLPLRAPGHRVTGLPPDSAGYHGLRVEATDRPPVDLYFDREGRVVRVRTTFATATGTPGESQDITLSGTVESGGIRWFRKMEIRRAGKPYFDLEIQSLTVAGELTDSLLAGPPWGKR